MAAQDNGDPHRYATHVYAIVRVDGAVGPESEDDALTSRITVKEVVTTLEVAKREVDRLSELNADKGCRYFWMTTRLYPTGTSAGSPPAASSAEHQHVVDVDGAEGRIHIHRLMSDGCQHLFTSTDLPGSEASEEERRAFALMLGENILLDTPAGRKALGAE